MLKLSQTNARRPSASDVDFTPQQCYHRRKDLNPDIVIGENTLEQYDKVVYTGADALTDALVAAGVTHVFLNSGTDYPPILESWAKYEAEGRKKPEIIISPHEYAALSAAQGFAQLTGQPQAVFVHVDVGTQNLGGAVHNAFRCRVPVYILAGVSPYTMEGELAGGRNAPIQFLQDVGDQAGIVRGYTKMNYELRSGKNIRQMVWRALQLAKTDPQGPVYTVASREVLEEESRAVDIDFKLWGPAAHAALDSQSVEILTAALCTAKKPPHRHVLSGPERKCRRRARAAERKTRHPGRQNLPFIYELPGRQRDAPGL